MNKKLKIFLNLDNLLFGLGILFYIFWPFLVTIAIILIGVWFGETINLIF